MVLFSKTPTQATLILHGKFIEQVPSLKYFSISFNQQSDHESEIKSRIKQARKVLNNMRILITNLSLDLDYRSQKNELMRSKCTHPDE